MWSPNSTVVLRRPPVIPHGTARSVSERLLQLLGINKPIPVELTIGEHHGNMVRVGGAQVVVGIHVDCPPANTCLLAGPGHHHSRFITQSAMGAGEEEDP